MVEDSKIKSEKEKIEASSTKIEAVYNILSLKGKCTSRDIANFIEAETKQKIDIHEVTSALYALVGNKRIKRVGKQGHYLLYQIISQNVQNNVTEDQKFSINTILSNIEERALEFDKQIEEIKKKNKEG